MLRYGDGTPFPFEEEFLDLLVDAVGACATMLAAAASLDRRRAEAEAVLQAIGEEERRLVLFERTIAAACANKLDDQPTPAARAAEHTRSAMETAVELSREQLRQISAVQAAPPSWHRAAQRVHAAAARFFAGRLLPGARWAWAWDASGEVARAEAASQDARFQVVYDLELPEGWRGPVRIDALVPDLVVRLPRRRWLRAPVEADVPLGRCLLVSARHDDRGRELVIRRPDDSSWRIDLPQDGQPSATALDRRGRTVGTGLVRETELSALVDAIERRLPTMQLPRTARDVQLDGKRVTELADTTLAARALLDAIGPTVREIRQRSRMPGELTLKRDVVDGRREELYVSRANLTALYGDLPGEYRRLLDDAGFGRGLTTGIAQLAAQASQPAIPARGTPSPPARASAPAIPARPSAAAAAARPTAPRPRHPTQPLLAQAPPRPSGSLTVPRTPRLTAEELQQRAVDPTIPSILAVPPRTPIRRLETPTS